MRLVCGQPCLFIFRHLNTGWHFWLNLYLLLGILRSVNLQQYYCCIWSILCVVGDCLMDVKRKKVPIWCGGVSAGGSRCSQMLLLPEVKHLRTHFRGSYEPKPHGGSESSGWTVTVAVVHTGIPSHSRKKKTKDQGLRWCKECLLAWNKWILLPSFASLLFGVLHL